MTDPLVLALDGSTDTCAAALLSYRSLQGGPRTWEVVAKRAVHDGRGQARVLLGLVDDMLAEVYGAAADIAAIVAGTGPGTFTGVRIAVATARSLALALRTPVLGVSTLGALAAAAAAKARVGVIVPVIDARRGQVFYGVYDPVDTAETDGGAPPLWRRLGEHAVCDRSEFVEILADLAGPRGEMTVIGAATALAERIEAIASGSGVRVRVAAVEAQWLVCGQDRLREPGGAPAGDRLQPYLTDSIVRRQGEKGIPDRLHVRAEVVELEVGQVGSPESVKPIYVRAPDADIHITKMRDPWATGR